MLSDADIETLELRRRAAEDAALERAGVCTHGWVQGAPGANDAALRHTEILRPAPNAPGFDVPVADGDARCLVCGAHVPDPLAGSA